MIRLIIEALAGAGVIVAGVALACVVGLAFARIPLREIRRPERRAGVRARRGDPHGSDSWGGRRRTASPRMCAALRETFERQRSAISPALVGSKPHAPK